MTTSMKLLGIALVTVACRNETSAAAPPTLPTTVTSATIDGPPDEQQKRMVRGEKTYFPVAGDTLATVCVPAEGFGDMRFARGERVLSADYADELRRIAACATTGPLAGRTLLVVGYADAAGSSMQNFDLSLRRAQFVRDALVSLGVDRSRVRVTSRGDLDAEGIDDATREADRRVEVVIAE